MLTNSPPPSAKIYQFPRKISAKSAIPATMSAADHRLRLAPSVEFGSGWYHDAAIQAERPRKS
jgi:hypothetical protein